METGTPGPESPAAAGGGPLTGPAAQVPQIRRGSGPPSAPYPAVLEFDRQEEYSRLLPFVKWLLAIPHYIALFFLFVGVFFALVVAWFAVLFTGKFPRGIHGFLTGSYRWATRVTAYLFLMTDRYPPFSLDHDEDYPARLDIAYTEDVARWRPLVHWILVIPYAIVAGVFIWVAQIFTFLAFFAILFTKNFPQSMFDFNVVALRWQGRANAYMYWMTERYPPFHWA